MNDHIDSKQELMEPKQLKSGFLYKTKHDIRSAMHVVIGMSQALTMSGTLSPSQKEMLAMLKKNAERTLELMTGMFDYLQATGQPDKTGSAIQESLPQKMEQDCEKKDVMPLSMVSGASEKNLHVLLVEDSAPEVSIVTSFLKELGYRYDVAKSGSEALVKFLEGHYNVIIMDVQMPDMDGLETTQHIRALEKEKNMAPIPILAATGNATGDDRLFCAKAGMNDFLSKPFELNELERKLQNVMRQKG